MTGHNLDDEAQNVLMNFLKGNVLLGVGQGPATGNGENVEDGFVQRVKPLFFVPESEILKYSKKMDFDILYDRCPCAYGTYRVDTREWMVGALSDGEKLRVVEGFMKVAKKMGKKDAREVVRCEVCGEIGRGKVCKFCEIVGSI